MKKLLKVSLFLLLLSNIALDLHGYAISHNKDSKLKEVTIFVFTDEKDFLKMLKKQGASTKVLNNMARIIPLVSTGASALATSLANPELVPIIKAVGLGLAGASKYAVGPAKWIMQQKYNLALHKHTKRGNKGKDASWNWKDIQKDEGVDPKDPFGLFVVFLNPKDKKVLWMGPMRSNAAFGFRAVTKDGKLIGERVSFERNKEETLKDPSYVARVYAYIVNRYENPDKIFRDIKRVFSDLKSTYKSFVKKYPDSASRLQFLNTKLDETKTAIKGGMKPEDIQELTAFFKREIEKAKEIAVDPETKEFAKRVLRKFNQFKSAADAIVLKPMAGYQSDAKSTGSTSSIIPELPLLIEGPKGENNYAILGVGKNASADEIKTAYRSLARQWHPDRNQDNKEEATAMFKKIKAAYDELSG